MTEKFCTYCGSQLTDEASFCHKCGSKIEMVDGTPAAMPMEETPTYIPAKQPVPYAPVQPVYHRPKALGIGIAILACIIVPIILIGVFGTISYVDIGTLDFEIASLDVTNIDLVMDNDVGSIDISYDYSMTKLFEATLEVQGRRGASLSEAKNFNLFYESGVKYVINFDSGDQKFFFLNRDVFSYDITIKLHPSAVVDYDIDASTGSISLITNGLDNLSIQDLDFETSTGRLSVDMSNSINTTIRNLDLNASTGRITVDLGTRTTITDISVYISTSTGSIIFSYTDLIVPSSIDWKIETSTGSITINIIQNLVLPYEHSSSFDVDTSTGSITMNISFNSTIGYAIEGTTSTGSVNILNSGTYYESPGFDLASNKYTFDLETSTGSVVASEF